VLPIRAQHTHPYARVVSTDAVFVMMLPLLLPPLWL